MLNQNATQRYFVDSHVLYVCLYLLQKTTKVDACGDAVFGVVELLENVLRRCENQYVVFQFVNRQWNATSRRLLYQINNLPVLNEMLVEETLLRSDVTLFAWLLKLRVGLDVQGRSMSKLFQTPFDTRFFKMVELGLSAKMVIDVECVLSALQDGSAKKISWIWEFSEFTKDIFNSHGKLSSNLFRTIFKRYHSLCVENSEDDNVAIEMFINQISV